MLHLTHRRVWIAGALLVLVALLLLAAWVADAFSVPKVAKDLPPSEHAVLPVDVAETPIGTFKCRINSDCPSDQWCYVTPEFAACTKK